MSHRLRAGAIALTCCLWLAGAVAEAQVHLEFTPLGAAVAKARTGAAPMDESFGHYPMSVFGIANAIARADKALAAGAAPTLTDGPIAYAVDSLRDWERRYPNDPWIAQDLFALERFYVHAGTDESRQCAERVSAWIAADYPHSPFAERARRAVANASGSDGETEK
jgi:hypothetical protein